MICVNLPNYLLIYSNITSGKQAVLGHQTLPILLYLLIAYSG
ncbi:hypothetical protein M23134_02065 [Microscilla marina ATCC 23134]|uniref:Uncharacterized protein n=1 Tax=Microscilla marina ATCC 23134 TaxID=313606 RepID=A1ZCN4_MICM2|nr:hypothetical protein M23134_02065 [Microscilla marina ATCC 23134]